MRTLTSRSMRRATPKKLVKTMQSTDVDLRKGLILYDNILVKPIMIERGGKKGTIETPQQYEDKAEWGQVIAVGEGRIFDNGTVIPLKVKVGDLVFFQKYSTQKLRHKGEDYLFIREEDIFYIHG